MLLQRLATGATGVKQARYRRGPTRGSEALYAHAQYNTQPVTCYGVMPAYEFRRGFCTLVLSLSCVYVCLCIRLFPLWLLQRPLKPANNGTHGFLLGFSWINMCGVSKKPSVEKLWREKANMQMSWSSPSAAFAQFRDQRNA